MENLFLKVTPESEGLDSRHILEMIEKFKEDELYMHSFLILRRGKLLAEGYYAPFTKETKHRMYSSTKSFVAGAIGLLQDEGKIQLDDPVHMYFPEFDKERMHPFIKNMTIRNLLEMRSPHTTTYSLDKDKWIESFFETEPMRPAGTVFRYDTSATYILDVIVERVTGKPFIDYMKDKMLRKLGFSEDATCVKAPDGYSWGGSGLLCTTRDLARYGYILMKKGYVGGEQLLSASFIEEATSKRVSPTYIRPLPTAYGYGYQIWKPRESAFSFNGMGCQCLICYPEKELIFACTADNQGIPYAYKTIYDAVHTLIANNLSDEALPENPAANESLQKTLSGLSLFKPHGEKKSPLMEKINGKTYILEKNPMDMEKVTFTFGEESGVFRYVKNGEKKEIPFGLGEYVPFAFPETHYSGETIGTPKGSGYRALGVGVWTSETEFTLRVNVIDDYFGNLSIGFGFAENSIGIATAKYAEGFLNEYEGKAGGFLE